MFENLSQKLTTTLRKVRGQGRLTETNIDDSLKEVKMALLEADVNFRVVKAFLKSVKSRAIGEEVQGSLTPGQQFIKIVNDELTNMMGASNESLTKSERPPPSGSWRVIMPRKDLVHILFLQTFIDQLRLINCRYLQIRFSYPAILLQMTKIQSKLRQQPWKQQEKVIGTWF